MRRGAWIVLAVAGFTVVNVAVAASGTTSDGYAGCLRAANGELYAVAPGDQPAQPCRSNDTVVDLAGAVHDHDGSYALAGISCPSGQFLTGIDATGNSVCGGLTSPDGAFSLTVGDAGIVLEGPAATVTMDAGSVEVEAAGPVEIRSSAVRLGSCGGPPVARMGDLVSTDESGLGRIIEGAATVTAC